MSTKYYSSSENSFVSLISIIIIGIAA